MMFALATPERPALYFTVLGEPPLKMLRYQQQFDFFDGEAHRPLGPLHQPVRRRHGRRPGPGAAAHRRGGRRCTARRWCSSTRSARWSSPAPARASPHHNAAAVRAAAGHADDQLAGHHLPDRRILRRDRRQPGVHRGRRPDLAAPERAAQLDGAQDGDHEDARPADAARAAHLSHQRGRHRGVRPGRHGRGASRPACRRTRKARGC